MSVSLSLPCSVSDELGGSLFYDEYKGDFAIARRRAGELRSEAEQRGDDCAARDAELGWNITSLLQGDCRAASERLAMLQQQAPPSSSEWVRASLYLMCVPCLRLFVSPDGAMGNCSDTEEYAHWDSNAYFEECGRVQSIGMGLASETGDLSLLLEVQLVGLLGSPVMLRGAVHYNIPSRVEFSATLLESRLKMIDNLFRHQNMVIPVVPSLRAYVAFTAADLCRRAEQADQAELYLRTALALYQEGRDLAGEAACHLRRGDWIAAPFNTPEVFNLAVSQGGVTYEDRLDPDKIAAALPAAREAYARAKTLFQEADAPRGLAAVTLRNGYVAALEKKWSDAAIAAERAEAMFHAAGDLVGARFAVAHQILINVGVQPWFSKKALARAKRLGAAGRKDTSLSLALGLGRMLSRAGERWLLEGDYDRSALCQRYASKLLQSAGVGLRTAAALLEAAETLTLAGNTSDALKLCAEASDKFFAISRTPSANAFHAYCEACRSTTHIMNIHINRVDIRGLTEVKVRMEKIVHGAPQYVNNQPDDLHDDASKALSQSFLAMVGMLESNIKKLEVLIPLYKARSAFKKCDDAGASPYFEQAFQAAQRMGNLDGLWLAASVLATARDYDKAAEFFDVYFEKSVENARSEIKAAGPRELQPMRRLLLAQHYDHALTFYAAIERYEQAQRCRESLMQMTESGEVPQIDSDTPWDTPTTFGRIESGLGRFDEALVQFDRAIDLLEAHRASISRDDSKRGFAGKTGIGDVYFDAARAAFQAFVGASHSKDDDKANQHLRTMVYRAVNGKSRSLIDLIHIAESLRGAPESENVALREWLTLNAKREAVQSQERSGVALRPGAAKDHKKIVDELNRDLERVENTLARTMPRVFDLVTDRTPATQPDDLCAALPPDTALLHYTFQGDRFLSWSLTRQGVLDVWHEDVQTRFLDQDLNTFLAGTSQPLNPQDCSDRLQELLLGRLGNAIRACHNLIIVPHGLAHRCPFHALPWEGKPLIETHTISYLPSASLLHFRSAGPAHAGGGILAVGNPHKMAWHDEMGNTKGGYFCPLPFAEVEAYRLGRSGTQNRALLGRGATKENVRRCLGDCGVLHLATHGCYNEAVPLRSCVFLADSETLTVAELMEWSINTGLVFLSACETGKGAVTGGDDVLGLTRGLLATGARTCIVSLWPANDIATAMLVEKFYALRADGTGKAEALRSAQLYVMSVTAAEALAYIEGAKSDISPENEQAEQILTGFTALEVSIRAKVKDSHEGLALHIFNHPYFWAPFVLVGNRN